ncbi:unnamed protein product, partial [marine sediment metagenome]
EALAKAFRLADGCRVLAVNTYFDNDERGGDLEPGPDAAGVWQNFWPIIADFLTDDLSAVEARKANISEDEWAKAREYGERDIQQPDFRPRDGRPFLSGICAALFD